ncbi:MAG: tetratricopeptide repeat protein [Bacteroidia bacterium]
MNKTVIYLLFAALLFVMAPVFTLAQGPGRNAFLAAENFRKQNKCDEAINQYNEAIRLEPSNYKYYFQRGKCEYKNKDFEAAKESFKSTVSYKKNFTPAYSLLAKIFKNEKDYSNAIYYYEEAARYESDAGRKVQYQLLLVNLLLKENRVSDAKKHIDDANSIDPNNPNILYYSAEINMLDSNWDAARRNYERALESDRLKSASPAEKAKYYYGLGLALTKIGDNAGARNAWSKANFGPYKDLIAQQMLTTNHVYYYKIAVSYYLNGEYTESENYISKALDLQRDFSSAFVLKGKIEGKKGNTARAIENYQKAIDFEKVPEKKAQMYKLVATLQLNNNDSYNALASIEKAMQADPKTAGSLYYLKAKAEYDSGRFREAIDTLEKLLASGVDTKAKAKYSFMLGMAAKKASDLEKAREAFKNALYGPYKPAAKIELDNITEKG